MTPNLRDSEPVKEFLINEVPGKVGAVGALMDSVDGAFSSDNAAVEGLQMRRTWWKN